MSFFCVVMILTGIYLRFRPAFMQNVISTVFTPVQKGFTQFGNWVKDEIGFLMELSSLDDENQRLRDENAELREKNSKLKLLEDENERLSELLKTDEKYKDYEKTGAQIIAKNPGNWYDSFIINKGSKSGISKGMTVLAAGGLVGRVVDDVGARYARVVAIIDSTSSVSAENMRTGATGFVKGDIALMQDGLCKMDLISEDSDMVVGDEIVTSNLSSIYPPGITIGFIQEVKSNLNGTKYAIVKPAVGFGSLETVLVVTGYEQNEFPPGERVVQ